jgi:nucleoside 2-deoxyribosyltransferase
MSPTVYLAGPISGLAYTGAMDWREEAIDELARAGIRGLSPMRCKEYLRGATNLDPMCRYGDLSPLSEARGVMTRDFFDTTRADVVLAHMLGAAQPSLGTVMEIAWAYQKRTPVIAVMEPHNPHEHAMVCEAIGFRVLTLAEGLALAKAILA